MALAPGLKLGPYEILSPLGAGGMGEVYKGRDTRLDRMVAIKILPEHLSASEDLRLRFEREARTISSLSHPNICALYDIGHQNGIEYLVMEFLEGETLSQKLSRGRLPPDQFFSYASQITGALDRAHKQGIIHRDLKPGNIMLTRSGAKLLDFGLAKFQSKTGPSISDQFSGAETADVSVTAQGTILGTLGYMSPEQLEGKDADARSDIFSLGVVLYEMATGVKAFAGSSQASVIAAILSHEPPPVTSIQPSLPLSLDRLIRTCLAKDPEERWQTAHDLLLQLKWSAEGGDLQKTAVMTAEPVPRKLSYLWTAIGIIAIAAITALGVTYFTSRNRVAPASSTPVRFTVLPPEKTDLNVDLAISPDGEKIAFIAGYKGNPVIWLRSLSDIEPEPLEGTEGARFPFWSPDNRFLGFFASRKLRKVEVATRNVLTLCDARDGRGGTWSSRGTILFSPHPLSGLQQIPATGGQPQPATELGDDEESHRFPQFLPDGDHFLYTAKNREDENSYIFVSSMAGETSEKVLVSQTGALFAPPGYLLFIQDNKLMARRFATENFQLSGDPVLVATGIHKDTETDLTGYGSFSASANGNLIYRTGSGYSSQIAWLNRNGVQIALVGPPGSYEEPYPSPDGQRLVLNREDAETRIRNLWLLELTAGRFSRFTFQDGDKSAVWHPDGRILYASQREGTFYLYSKHSSGTQGEQLLLESRSSNWPTDVSGDGRYLLYESYDPGTRLDLWILNLQGKPAPAPFLRAAYNETQGQFSPDGKWIAYASDETGRLEVYVQNFPATGAKWQISTNGGAQPAWRNDGNELFYLDAESRMISVAINRESGFQPGVPVPLFESGVSRVEPGWNKQYFPSPNGDRFLINTRSKEPGQSQITVVLNWTSELMRQEPSTR